MKSDLPLLFYSNTKIDKNLKYLIKCDVEDDFCLLKIGDYLIAMASALEITRLKQESKINKIYSIEQFRKNQCELSVIVDNFIQHNVHSHSIIVPYNFPFKLAQKLIKLGYSIDTYQQNILPERTIKSLEEIQNIKKVLEVINLCFEYIQDIISKSKISKSNELYIDNTLLTSEFLRHEIENFCYKHNLISNNTIASCGKQSAYPHCQGNGLIYSNEFTVIDIFPYDRESGYYADITRTFLKGSASNKQIKMYNTVKNSQDLAYKALKPGITCQELMANTLDFFEKEGYKTDKAADIPYGMFHSLGHGFGLDIHEPPTLSNNINTLQNGNIITLEPGLYYPEIGGVRIEDDFLITNTGAVKLSDNIPYNWVIN